MKDLRPALAGCMAVVAAIAVSATPAAAQAGDFYSGRTIRVLVGLQAGGTVDSLARALTPYVRRHIPGNPSIIIQNMPGAGGAGATNYLAEKAAPDGLTVLFGPWDPMGQVLGDQALRARYQDFAFLGGNGDIRIVYMRSDAVQGGMTKPADIARADNLVLGALNSTDQSGLLPHLMLDVLGIRHKMIVGYRGGSDVFLAMERGEVQIHSTSISAFFTRNVDFIGSKQGIGVSYLVPVETDGSYQRTALLPGIPAFPDLYQEIHGRMPAGASFDALNWLTQQVGELTYVAFAPRGTPAAAVAALRKGFGEACSDPDFVRDSVARNKIAYSCIGVARGESVLHSLAEVSPQVVRTLRASVGVNR